MAAALGERRAGNGLMGGEEGRRQLIWEEVKRGKTEHNAEYSNRSCLEISYAQVKVNPHRRRQKNMSWKRCAEMLYLVKEFLWIKSFLTSAHTDHRIMIRLQQQTGTATNWEDWWWEIDVSWFNPSQQPSTTQPLPHSAAPAPSGMGRRIGKEGKTCGLR